MSSFHDELSTVNPMHPRLINLHMQYKTVGSTRLCASQTISLSIPRYNTRIHLYQSKCIFIGCCILIARKLCKHDFSLLMGHPCKLNSMQLDCSAEFMLSFCSHASPADRMGLITVAQVVHVTGPGCHTFVFKYSRARW